MSANATNNWFHNQDISINSFLSFSFPVIGLRCLVPCLLSRPLEALSYFANS